MSDEVKDLSEMSEDEIEALPLDQLRELSNKELVANIPADDGEPKAQPRDASGKFAKVEDKTDDQADDEQDDDEEEVKEFVYSVDLGDGSGKQVFKGGTYQEVIDKLLQAQTNATRKISELAKEKKDREAVEAAEAADTDYVLSQEMLTKPTSAIKKVFKQVTGMEVEDFKSTAQAMKEFNENQRKQNIQTEEARKQNEASTAFLADTPDYVATPKNGAKLQKAILLQANLLQQQGKEINYRTLITEAYQDLLESGLLETKPKEVDDAAKPSETATSRIVKPEDVTTTQRRKGSGISSRNRVATPPKVELSEEELENIPLDKLKEMANKQLREQFANSD